MAMSCPRDWISSMPDEILGKIMSLLPTKVAASTSILSKRWKNLMGLVDSLCFDESMVVYPNEEEAASGAHRFLDFVDKTFAGLLSNSRIKKFSLSRVHKYGYGSYEFDRVNRCVSRWVQTAFERGVLELHLHAGPPYSGLYIETELLTSKTLVKLTLSGDYFLEAEGVFFPALKSLDLLSLYGLDYPNFARLIHGCPLLEDLYIRDDPSHPTCGGLDVESESIKRLVVYLNHPMCPEDQDLTCFEAPNLVYLDYSGYVSGNYTCVDLDSLVHVRLSLRLWESTNTYDDDDHDTDMDIDGGYASSDSDDDQPVPAAPPPIFGDVTNLVAGITNITTLHLSPDSLEAFHFCCESMPVFNNLLTLSIESNKDQGWQVMPLLLKSCPNLHTLVIKGLVHRVTNRCGDACACFPKKQSKILNKEELSCLWTCQVKVLEIYEYGGSFQEMKQMIHFLDKLACLETVKVGVAADKYYKRKFLRANLLGLPRVSSKCDIQFI